MAWSYDGSGVHEIYDTARRLSTEARELFSLAIAEHLGPGPIGRVLDLGCGTGRFSRLLRDVLSTSVCALDASADMIGAAARQPDRRRIRFVRGHAEALPLGTATMDAAFTAMVYHHIADKDAALGECARVLRPAGRLLIYTPTREALHSFLWMRFFPTAVRIDTERMPSRPQLVETVCRASFDLERHVILERRFAEDLDEYARRIGMRSFSTLRMVSDAEFESGMAELRRYCAESRRGQTIAEELDLFVFRRQPRAAA
jgi:ubiquinone/menaquinone biosynthesis C-methylase UbiE